MATTHWRQIPIACVLLASLALAGCASFPGAYPGGYGGDPYGYPDRGYGAQAIGGTVQDVDPSSGRILLATEGSAYGGYGSTLEVWVDGSTRLFYQGREQDPRGLERGDGVRIEVVDDGRRLRARTIEVTRNVREGGGYYGGSAGAFEAAVRYVDPQRRLIEVTRGGYAGRVEQVWYDERTRFDYRGQLVSPTQLEAGDVVRIEARPSGNAWLATYVSVTVNARSR
jgi:hypothetical protein